MFIIYKIVSLAPFLGGKEKWIVGLFMSKENANKYLVKLHEARETYCSYVTEEIATDINILENGKLMIGK